MPNLPEFRTGQNADRAHRVLKDSVGILDRAQRCAGLWFGGETGGATTGTSSRPKRGAGGSPRTAANGGGDLRQCSGPLLDHTGGPRQTPQHPQLAIVVGLVEDQARR